MGSGKRARGPNKAVPWSRRADDGLSVLRMALDTTDPLQRKRIEEIFSAAHSVHRAVQRDAQDRALAYWAAHHERKQNAGAVRERLGLSRKALEHTAYAHVDAAPHLRRAVTKALAMHLADSVWTATERHLFRDATGARQGVPRPGSWFDFTRIPGRARSHTTEHKWETFRLHGSLAGHRAAYTGCDGRFAQPRRMRQVLEPDNGWWSHRRPLAIVFTGLAVGTLVLPVRLPASASNQPILDHHLGDPSRWHKIDLVRHRDPMAPGGWRYEAHLVVLTLPYVAPATQRRRQEAAIMTAGRSAGIDVNVSNITVASHVDGGDLKITRVAATVAEKRSSGERSGRKRRRKRRLDRSRRALNASQYALSPRQAAHVQRREAAGLPPVQLVPKGPRKCRADGKPAQAYRYDQLSRSYRRERAAGARDAEAAAQARRGLAREISARLVREHGFRLVVEDCDIRAWARSWGGGIAAFTPGILVEALECEASAVARLAGERERLLRISVLSTALSQHCMCGERVAKTLSDRIHKCLACGLRGDRDAVSAALAACVAITDQESPTVVEVDRDLARRLLEAAGTRQRLLSTLPYALCGRQDVRSESTVHSARDGWSVAETGPTPDFVAVARRIVGRASYSTLDETGLRRPTTSDRARTRTNLPRSRVAWSTRLRDSS